MKRVSKQTQIKDIYHVKNVIQVAYGLSTNQIRRKEKSCKAILLRKGEVTFLLGVQIDKTIYLLWGKYYLKIHTQIAQCL